MSSNRYHERSHARGARDGVRRDDGHVRHARDVTRGYGEGQARRWMFETGNLRQYDSDRTSSYRGAYWAAVANRQPDWAGGEAPATMYAAEPEMAPPQRYSAPPDGGFANRGPRDYRRSDERIREDVCDHLTADELVDASHVEVLVESGVVHLSGSVATRAEKYRAEDIAVAARGVIDVYNELRVSRDPRAARSMADELDMTGRPLGESAYQRTGRRS
jgi:hypothetical protein